MTLLTFASKVAQPVQSFSMDSIYYSIKEETNHHYLVLDQNKEGFLLLNLTFRKMTFSSLGSALLVDCTCKTQNNYKVKGHGP